MRTPQVFYSAELRWWGKGYLPQPIHTALKQFPYRDQPPRLDQYLNQQSVLSSIKWRENALEIKSMVRDPVDLPGEHTRFGPITFWEKWRLHTELRLEGDEWLRLHKYRSVALRDANGQWLLQVPATPLRAGCQLEWTKVEYKGYTYWSIGLEAFSEEGLNQAEKLILSTWLQLIEKVPDLRAILFQAERMDYPTWMRNQSLLIGL